MAIQLSGVKPKVQPAAHLMRPSDERIIFGSTEKIRKDTGWKPLMSLKDTLKSMIDYWSAVQ
jgi:GDP-4-dehydro-6-deoxy-D-mannose reductase